MIVPQSTAYGWLMLAGIVVSIALWARLARRDDRLLMVYVGALIGAFLGAKVFYLLVDGWRVIGRPDVWTQLATGKTVLGALLGGYLGVEIAKRLVSYGGVTGDWFALIAPVGIVLGRVGCLLHGCCQGRVCEAAWFTMTDPEGVTRWPSVPMEILFNAVAIAVFFFLRQRHVLPGQLFHLYLIAYGVFRFFHEFLRNESLLIGPLTGYQLLAAGVAVFGSVAFILRRNMSASAAITKPAAPPARSSTSPV
jgi:phosphatidylglycerol:prolipoprotein diacylglycerol transferase